MMPVEAFFGFVGAILFVGMIYYTKMALNHFEDHRDISMVKFFIDDKGVESFRLLGATALLYAVAMFVTGLEFLIQSERILIISRGLILAVTGMMAYFLREIYLLTKKTAEK